MTASKENPCPICQKTNYEWGHIQASGLSYFTENTGFFKKTFGGGYKLQARLCKNCQNIQIFKI